MKKYIRFLVVGIMVFIVSMIATVSASAMVTMTRETESNNTVSTADLLTVGDTGGDGASIYNSYISTYGDVDYFTFTAPRHGR